MKILPKRYVNEKAVKRALKINSFRNLSKDKVMQFVSMIPYIDKEVAISIIKQFPVYADFGKVAIEQYTKECNSILELNKESQNDVIRGYQTILDALSTRMENKDISEQEYRSITNDMIAVADKIDEADLNNKKFLERMSTKAWLLFLLICGAVGAAIGINSAFSNGSSLPEIQEEQEEQDEE